MAAQPNQMFYTDGEFYQCAIATNPGANPVDNPTLWRRIQLKKEWRWLLARLTYAHLLKLDGQTSKALAERAEAQQTERVGLEDMVRLAANQEQNRQRPNVQTPRSPTSAF